MPDPSAAPALEPTFAPPALHAVPATGGGQPRAYEAPTPRLELPPYDFAAALALERELGISHALAQILVRRGLHEPSAARRFLSADELDDPAAFAGIDRAMEVISSHIAAGGRITIHGDYDVDGVCATAVLLGALRSLGADVDWFLPSRIDDGYGLSADTVARLASRATSLLITVDCGITAVEQVAAARAAGLDVVITDHHAPRADGELPRCPIVHPRVCGYPCADLCGTAVAYKLAQALGADTAGEDIELVALATVADLMPLTGENRTLVRQGIRAMSNTTRPGLQALMAVARVDPSALDAHALAFRLAPRINAAGRLQRADAGLELLLTDQRDRAEEIALELDELNLERRAVEQRIVWEADRQASERPERSAFVLAAQGWHPGVIGIVASRVVERYHRPAILVAVGSDGMCQGSGRSIPGFDLLAGLDACASYLERYGGHRAAAGLTIAGERLGEFAQEFEQHAADVLTPELLQPVERADAIVSGSELGLPLAEELLELEPCGIGNAAPRMLIAGARFDAIRPMGDGRHARFAVISGGARASAVAFGCEGRLSVEPEQPCDCTFRLERNVWNGAVEPRLVLRHLWPCSPAPIDVLGEPDRYLDGALIELDRPLIDRPTHDSTAESAAVAPAEGPIELDRRGESALAVLADACATGEPVVAVCADVPRRLAGLRARAGGFALISYHALELDPRCLARYVHVVVLDPPATAETAGLLRRRWGGRACRPRFIHMAWGLAELRFAQQMHELEYGLRTSLAVLYRGLRHRERVAGEELEQLLRGDGPHGRPARLAGRLMRVLAELELVSLDRDLPALAIASAQHTTLERSPAYRVYSKRYEDGRRFLSSARLRAAG